MEIRADASTPRAELRNFGLVLGAAFAVLFGLLPLWRRHALVAWPWALAALLWLDALAWPQSLALLHRWWTRLGHALGWFNTRVILTLIFMLFVTPFGFVMWVFGRDRMRRGFDPKSETYRVPSTPHPPRAMEKPF
jgi:Saxitoxin biosynthesis operon protein SxtJ